MAIEADRMGRAARAAARALALDQSNDWCAAVRRELHLDADFDCDAAWTVSIDHRVSPAALVDGAPPAVIPLDAPLTSGGGELVLVRIEWALAPWPVPNIVPVANAEPADDPGDEASATPPLTTRVVFGLARYEPGG